MLKSRVEKLIARGRVEQDRRGELAEPVVEAPDRFGAERLLGGLQRVHRLGDGAQALDRVGDVDRQRAAHRRQPVAELAVLVLGADRDRDQRLQLELVGVDVAVLQPAPQGAGGDRQGDVVDGAAERVLDLFEVVELAGRPGEAAVGADVGVEGDLRAPAWSGSSPPPRGRRRRRDARASGPCAGPATRAPEPAAGAAEHADEAARPTSPSQLPPAGRRAAGAQGSSVRTISCLGSTSKSSMPTSVAEIPSAIEWWVL